MRVRKILYIINTSKLFVSHRMHLAQAAKKNGFEVHILAPEDGETHILTENGFAYHNLGLNRKSMNPFVEIQTLFRILKTIYKIKPDIVHSFTIKPVLYAGLSSLFFRKKKFISTITGLGYLFIREDLMAKIIRIPIALLYRVAFLKKDSKVIFQNHDDQNLFVTSGWVKKDKTQVIFGTGVDTDRFLPSSLSEIPPAPRILFPARFLKDKGIMELVNAGKILASKNLEFKILLCGGLDEGNKSSITQSDLNSICKLPFIIHRGYCKDMAAEYKECEIVCLPSYREGIPLALIEACASGKAIVTTDVPGCREVISYGYNGYSVPSKDSVGLAEALQKLIESSDLIQMFSMNSREFALKKFEKNFVVKQNIDLYVN